MRLSPKAARLAAELETGDTRTVRLPELWRLYGRADPASATRPTRRADLAAAITELAAAGVLTPSKKAADSGTPPLPAQVTLPAPAASVTAAALARAVAWRPELAWAASARLTVGQVGLLQAVNVWLRDRGRDADVVPLRERSLELFGYEKRLDTMVSTSLFGPDRLSLGLLRTFRAHPPLPVRRVGDGPILLVVENADTFDTLRKALTAGSGHRVGWIAWGAGAGFEASVLSIGELPEVTEVAYFGDLDAVGLRIATSAARTAATERLPVVRPAHGLYRLLLDHGVPQPGQPSADGALAGWLAEPSAVARAARLLTEGARIPQEAVSARALAGAPEDWLDGLS